MVRKKQKLNNPFKLVGSYVGAFLSPFILMIIGPDVPFFNLTLPQMFEGLSTIPIGIFLIILIVGFLIGWGIEVLLRKTKIFGLK